MKRNKKDNLLYTKLNKNTHLYEYYYNTTKNRYRYNRHAKDIDKTNKKNHKSNTNSSYSTIYDYSPLYKFLLKNVGNNWSEIFRVCQSKLNDVEPITKMVINVNTRGLVIDNVDIKNINQYTPYFKSGPNTCFSTLYVDENDIIQYVDKLFEIKKSRYFNETLTFNGHIKPLNEF